MGCMGKPRAIATAHKRRLHESGGAAAPDFEKIRDHIQAALDGGASSELNERGEVVFKRERSEPRGAREARAERKDRQEKKSARASAAKVDDVPRLQTGISGFDELIPGGIPRDSIVLVVGGPGSGKSIFSMQFLFNGATKFNEPGAYVSFEEQEKSVRETSKLFGWDIDDLEEKNLLKVVWRDPYEVKSFAKAMGGQIYYLLKEYGIKRIVFDSITYFTLTEVDRFKLRKEISELSRRLKSLGVTSFFIAEVPEGEAEAGRYGMEEFVADGIIYLHNFLVGDTRVRAVEVLKLRKSSHDTFLHPFKITRSGIEVYPHERVFKE